MLELFNFVREMSFLGILARMVTAVICGGFIGIEREYKRRPAGFRTHILICLGAAMTTLTSQYMFLVQGLFTDVGRLGAQVVAGIGFIGAGTIIVTKRQRVKGLTTAAGLWTAAIIGLVCGAGYVECALFATFMVLFAELLLIKIEYRFSKKKKDAHVFIEYRHAVCIEAIIHHLRDRHVKMEGLEITRIPYGEGHRYHAVLTVQATGGTFEEDVIRPLTTLEDVISVEEL